MNLFKPKSIAQIQWNGVLSVQQDYILSKAEQGIFVMADGFGVDGGRAAKQACEATRSFLEKEAGDRDATLPFVLRPYYSLAGNILFNSLIFANRKLAKENSGKTQSLKSGSSVLAAYMDGNLLALASVGSSSAWLVRGGQASRLIIPRSYGILVSPELFEDFSNVPLMALGMYDNLEPEIAEYKLQAGDYLLLYTGVLSEARREQICRGALGQEKPEILLGRLGGESSPTSNVSILLANF